MASQDASSNQFANILTQTKKRGCYSFDQFVNIIRWSQWKRVKVHPLFVQLDKKLKMGFSLFHCPFTYQEMKNQLARHISFFVSVAHAEFRNERSFAFFFSKENKKQTQIDTLLYPFSEIKKKNYKSCISFSFIWRKHKIKTLRMMDSFFIFLKKALRELQMMQSGRCVHFSSN